MHMAIQVTEVYFSDIFGLQPLFLAHSSQNHFNFLMHKMLIKLPFWSHPGVLVARGTNLVIRGLELTAPPPDFPKEKEAFWSLFRRSSTLSKQHTFSCHLAGPHAQRGQKFLCSGPRLMNLFTWLLIHIL